MTRDAEGRGPRLRLEVSGGRGARMALHGEFDIRSAEAATRALGELLERRPQAVVIDLSGLDFIDSTGVKFLVGAHERATALGVELALVPGGELVQRVLTVSGVATLFARAD